MNALPRALLCTLPALLLLTASPARADLPHESMYLTRSEIPDESLRGVIGIGFVSVFTGLEQVLDGQEPLPIRGFDGEIPVFVPGEDGFTPDGTRSLSAARPISGWDYDFTALRKFPAVEQRGDYVHVVINARTNERAWLRLNKDNGKKPQVGFTTFASREWAWSGIDVHHLAPKSETRLYGAPRPEARWHSLSPSRPARREGAVVGDLRIIKTHGNFMQVGELINLDEELAPVGWVPINDENGVLLIWPVYAPMC
ncbi:hypothetical protein [Archangium lansingense]|uniref:Uncharacterized protein n=1 Tax=Archangium lansingense TaxID=2995310 RepID=A0ABT4APK6_9BACT|nr:hypothetical protein [Archangium lansinium]MCY1083609.1 hypothetical protein [Archangium lansinium]